MKQENSNWQQALSSLSGAYADNTLLAYASDFSIFEAWCRRVNRTALPASSMTVVAFMDFDASQSATATVSRRLAAIGKIHRLMRLPSPIDDENVRLAMHKVLRAKPRRQRQALGLTAPLRDRLIAACPPTLVGLRNRALIAVGYDTLCRRSELIALRVDDLSPLDDGAMTILVRRAKNDPFGEGRLAYLTPRTVGLLNEWLNTANLRSGPLFRSLKTGKASRHALASDSIGRLMKSLGRAAGFSPDQIAILTGHSMRVGAAQDMMAGGIDLISIMQTGGWRKPGIVERYVRNVEVTRNGIARLQKLNQTK